MFLLLIYLASIQQHSEKLGIIKMTGIVVRKMEGKFFGFLQVDGKKEQEYFFHGSDCNKTFNNIRVGETASFDGKETSKGKRASNVVFAED
jgi:cold shock CspA family protein